jgi:hypothetical protein
LKMPLLVEILKECFKNMVRVDDGGGDIASM